MATGLTRLAWRSVRVESGGAAAAAAALADPLVVDQLRSGPVVIVAGRANLAESTSSAAATLRAVYDAVAAVQPDVSVLPALRRGNVVGALQLGLRPRPGGLDAAGILTAAAGGGIDILVLLGADPLADFPDAALARQAIDRAGVVVALDCVPHRLGGARRRRVAGVDVRREGRDDDEPRGPCAPPSPSGSRRRAPPGPTGWSPPSWPTCSASTSWRRRCSTSTRSRTPSPSRCRPTRRPHGGRWRATAREFSPSTPATAGASAALGGTPPATATATTTASCSPAGSTTGRRRRRCRRRSPVSPATATPTSTPPTPTRSARRTTAPCVSSAPAARCACRCAATPASRAATVLVPFNRGSDINSIVDATTAATDVRIEVD